MKIINQTIERKRLVPFSNPRQPAWTLSRILLVALTSLPSLLHSMFRVSFVNRTTLLGGKPIRHSENG